MVALLDRRRSDSASRRTNNPMSETSQFGGPILPPTSPTPSTEPSVGGHRRRQAAAIVGLALATGLIGAAVGSRVRSPADAAAARNAPVASRITVGLERRPLDSTLILSGDVRYDEPAPIALAGAVGLGVDEVQVLTRVPEVGQAITEGEAVFEVSGRPVVFLQGDLPLYRSLSVGLQGPDVAQLELALDRLGLEPGTVDDVFDASTAAALATLYDRAGYAVEPATPEQVEAVRLAGEALASAEVAVAESKAALATGAAGASPSERLSLTQAVEATRAAVPIAERSAANDDAAAQAEIDRATTAVAAATAARDAAVAERDAAAASETGADPSLAALVGEADIALADAQAALTSATNAKPVINATGAANVKSARDAVALAEAQQRDATAAVDTSSLSAAVDAATKNVERAQIELVTAEAAAGPRLSPGEIVFVPTLPSAVTDLVYGMGDVVGGEQLATIATSDTTVNAGISRADAQLVQPGDVVSIELRGADLSVDGTVVSVGAAESSDSDEAASTDTGRLQLVVLPDDPSALIDHIGAGVKLRIAVASTGGDVLVVPAAALTVGADGVSRIDVERSPVTAGDPGLTETIPVDVGLAANGFVEITARPGATPLVEGDRIVVGVDAASSTSTDAGTDSEGDGVPADG